MDSARFPNRILWIALFLGLAGGLLWLSGEIAERNAIARLSAETRGAAILRQAYLKSEIERFRLLPIALSDDSDLVAGLTGSQAALRALDRKLQALARTTGAAQIYVLDASGRTVASSNWGSERSFVGQDYSFRNYFKLAAAHGSGAQFALGTISERPGMYLSRRSRGGGYVVVKLEFDGIEQQWARLGEITFITSREGIILITSRPDWRFTTIHPLSAQAKQRFRAELQSGRGSLLPVQLRGMGDADGRQIVSPADEPRRRLLWQSVAAGEPGWQLNMLTPLHGVESFVRTVRLATLLLLLLLAGGIWILRERGHRRAERAAMAAARTRELRREMEERAASETRADTLREGLRQANRLASLGQITAGIAHETAQPVAAIRSYAANGRLLIERGDSEAAAENMAAIERLTDRIGKVTAELRGFSRKATGAIDAIPLAGPIEGSVLILKSRLARVDLHLPDLPDDLRVMADMIRLEQVLVNLLQNALEALEGVTAPAIRLSVALDAETVLLSVIDNGPGIDPSVQGQLFTPFVTSRPSGLGLGLVIASDIMADMGGSLRLLPSEAGAHFQLSLKRA
ncbi:sensor histidine kinase [Sphingobium yanoikuyae]|uniref:sensor histidine kinase n=1 Tax=Sphingobium yanoikuyae TaxID=13690 RepID=UPI0004E464E0|nr:ATP-binding protein [Sphingobium yanoikuyae]KFD29733.1 histidine kinase [Sphingobium yanoikuyae]MDV3481117.1 ATP-binding protein [Sphingobium yanoikuyae]